MATSLQTQEKKELAGDGEHTQAGKHYMPYTDIHETEDKVVVTMDMPGVDKNHIDVSLEKNVLTVVGKIDFSNYDDMEPAYTEYNVGHYTRRFTLSSNVDQREIAARIANGVLTVELPKIKEVVARRIAVQ